MTSDTAAKASFVKRIIGLAVCAGAAAWSSVAPIPAAAQDVELKNNNIVFVYEEPKNTAHLALYERLKNRRVLEQFKAFLSPLRMTRKLTLRTLDCNTPNAFYNSSSNSLELCYEYFLQLEQSVPREPSPEGFTQGQAIVGGFLGIALHELGHAVFNLKDVPIFGREEDAADQIAGFILLQFGPEIAHRMIRGAAYMWLAKGREPPLRSIYSDEHGTDGQRYYNFLCLGYGGPERKQFQDLVDKGFLPADRAVNCEREYNQVRNAFVQTVLPWIDQDMMKKVRSMKWLDDDEGK
ncbi:MAG: hypothetical protein QOG83_263 [Alphaproteobacteria bacterium]|nr:hypothetical protein [Alphaproteobacteria bacterium]